jgi:phosphoglycolate phosphatase-like HAD superfamily hydrolase
MLVLFDIDGTLLQTGGAGVSSFSQAGKHLYGSRFTLDGVVLAGRLDGSIHRDAAQAAGVDPSSDEGFCAEYSKRLGTLLETGARRSEVLPGARAFVNHIATSDVHTCGVLTGNWSQSGRLKLEAAGLDPDRFAVQAWAEDSNTRSGLVEVALRRWRQKGGSGEGADAVIVGDTPHDVRCGQAHGCRTLAVATGPVDRTELEAAGADRVVDDLEDFSTLLDWLGASQS